MKVLRLLMVLVSYRRHGKDKGGPQPLRSVWGVGSSCGRLESAALASSCG